MTHRRRRTRSSRRSSRKGSSLLALHTLSHQKMYKRKSASSANDRSSKASAAGPKAAQKRAAEERERAGAKHTSHEQSRFLRGDRIEPRAIDGRETAAHLIDNAFLAYNAARLREACGLFVKT